MANQNANPRNVFPAALAMQNYLHSHKDTPIDYQQLHEAFMRIP